MRHSNGVWQGYTYEWNADGLDATLLPSQSKTKTIPGVGHNPINWTYPSRQQCMVCHNDSVGVTLGLETLQINGDFKYVSTGRTSNQLSTWDHIGLFAQPIPAANASPALIERSPLSTSLTRRVRSYLHSNCSYCHNPGTGLANVDLRYTASMADMKACNAEPDRQHPGRGRRGSAGSRRRNPVDHCAANDEARFRPKCLRSRCRHSGRGGSIPSPGSASSPGSGTPASVTPQRTWTATPTAFLMLPTTASTSPTPIRPTTTRTVSATAATATSTTTA